ncbi:MAG: glycosyltransferase [Anaerolineaceae bacterium]|nr:glycosyltransferase [Anaerolineaceae bacterium]
MKLLVVCASLDLTQPFSATPAWWQLLKGFYEIGIEVIATPYQGPAIESLWWQAAPNPAKWQGDAFKAMRDALRKVGGEKPPVQIQAESAPDSGSLFATAAETEDAESLSNKVIRQTVQTFITPLWLRHLDDILTKKPDIDAVLILTAPLNHLNGVAAEIQRKHGKPVFYYDGDVPASLPNLRGFASGFRIYQGADPGEYTAVISNSQGGEDALKALGAKDVYTVYYGADPTVFSPVSVPAQDIDVMFYGHGREYRASWIDAMIAAPAQALPDNRFAVRGTKLGDLGPTQLLPYLSFSKLREYACRSKINLCITRRAHASVFASSSSRPFELSSMGCCIVANPYEGIETWFEPDKELIIVHSEAEAIDRYRYLLAHESERLAMGQAARERVLKEHTFQHRARQFVEIIERYL